MDGERGFMVLYVRSPELNSVATEHSHGETSLSVVAKSAKTRKGNVFPTVAKFATVQNEGGRQIVRQVEYYNLDVILSVGYRVKSPQGILFRRWANTVLKEYLLRGYSFNTRLNQLEDKMDRRLAKHDQDIVELKDKVDFFVQTSLPPRQGVFYDGQLWDARVFAERLIGGAKKSLVLIDNWATVLRNRFRRYADNHTN